MACQPRCGTASRRALAGRPGAARPPAQGHLAHRHLPRAACWSAAAPEARSPVPAPPAGVPARARWTGAPAAGPWGPAPPCGHRPRSHAGGQAACRAGRPACSTQGRAGGRAARLRQLLVVALEGSLSTLPVSQSCGAGPVAAGSMGGGVGGAAAATSACSRCTCERDPSTQPGKGPAPDLAAGAHLLGDQLPLAAEGQVKLHGSAGHGELGEVHTPRAHVDPRVLHDQVAGMEEDVLRAAGRPAGAGRVGPASSELSRQGRAGRTSGSQRCRSAAGPRRAGGCQAAGGPPGPCAWLSCWSCRQPEEALGWAAQAQGRQAAALRCWQAALSWPARRAAPLGEQREEAPLARPSLIGRAGCWGGGGGGTDKGEVGTSRQAADCPDLGSPCVLGPALASSAPSTPPWAVWLAHCTAARAGQASTAAPRPGTSPDAGGRLWPALRSTATGSRPGASPQLPWPPAFCCCVQVSRRR